MAAKYELKIITDFASAHSLRNYPGACRNLHGHNWKVEVEVIATALDEIGMGIDFKVIKKATAEVANRLDHTYLNDIHPFTEINPTAENIAAYFYSQLSTLLNGPNVRISAVSLWETERACVRYTED